MSTCCVSLFVSLFSPLWKKRRRRRLLIKSSLSSATFCVVGWRRRRRRKRAAVKRQQQRRKGNSRCFNSMNCRAQKRTRIIGDTAAAAAAAQQQKNNIKKKEEPKKSVAAAAVNNPMCVWMLVGNINIFKYTFKLNNCIQRSECVCVDRGLHNGEMTRLKMRIIKTADGGGDALTHRRRKRTAAEARSKPRLALIQSNGRRIGAFNNKYRFKHSSSIKRRRRRRRRRTDVHWSEFKALFS